MRKVFKMQDLECANCAAKMEAKISKLEGVKSARVNFMAQKLTLEAEDDRFEALVEEAARICSSIESDCVIMR